MNTKILMTSSALFMAIIGIVLSFLPHEIAAYFNVEPNLITILFLNILSALYLIMTVWMISTFGWETMQDQELMQERLQEMMGQ